MQIWTEIRRKVLVEKVSRRQICRDYKISHHTLAKMLENVEPPGYQQQPGERSRPKLGAFIGTIEEILRLDQDAPKKQRHTAKRIFERLRDEHGYSGSESQVRRYLAANDHRHREVFVALSQPPGEAQFDFGEATLITAGVRMKAALAVMSLPYSDAFFVAAYPRECTETFQASHGSAFEFFGAVPTKIAYDNTSVALKRVLEGPNRELTTEFLRLESHYLFTHRFCSVARQREGPRGELGGLSPAQLPRPGAKLCELRGTQRILGTTLCERTGPHGSCSERNEATTTRRRWRRDASVPEGHLRVATHRYCQVQLAEPGAL